MRLVCGRGMEIGNGEKKNHRAQGVAGARPRLGAEGMICVHGELWWAAISEPCRREARNGFLRVEVLKLLRLSSRLMEYFSGK